MLKNIIYFLSVASLFGLFNRTPFESFQNIILLIVSMDGLYLFIFKRNKYIIKECQIILWGAMFLVILSTIRAYLIQGQDLVSGVIAQGNIFQSFVGVSLFVRMKIYNGIDFKQIERCLIWFIWINFIYYLLANLFIPEFTYSSYLTGANYNFLPSNITRSFIVLGFFYYFYGYLKTNKIQSLLYCLLLFLITNIIEFQRMQVLVICLTVFIYLAFFNDKRLILFMTLVIMFFVSITYVLYTIGVQIESLNFVIDYFGDAFRVFTNGESEDYSALGRIRQFDFIYEDLVKNLVLGNGKLRPIFIDILYGEDFYLHIGDLGIIGVIYTYGLIIIPFILYFIKLVLIKCFKPLQSILGGCLSIYMLHFVFFTIINGSFVWQMDIIVLSLLVWFQIYFFESFKFGSIFLNHNYSNQLVIKNNPI
ncbi:hypothetical protein [Algoriphagus halophytocola]|uniref:Oligosaccharide repeat unit polymerase n=1 Tax=Algoriphagus halophytocola TaxID=2991499 RepID=A0ABY6ML74_9BACT|nr:hypothetical protein [Algoriphagus sp. TR-M5]UZD23875.1 hypothetical protein OM944_05125 [Algoriphagus sp. TR-M5]